MTAADGHERAAEAIRSLRNRIVHFSVSDPADTRRTAYAEFDLPMSEQIIDMFSILLANAQARDVELKDLYDQVSRQASPKPSAKVLAALGELDQASPWFKTKEDLFRALEAPDEE